MGSLKRQVCTSTRGHDREMGSTHSCPTQPMLLPGEFVVAFEQQEMLACGLDIKNTGGRQELAASRWRALSRDPLPRQRQVVEDPGMLQIPGAGDEPTWG